jgi:hypothetical protein
MGSSGMSEEKTAGLIPRIVVRNALVTREYAVLVTDVRSIFILQSTTQRSVRGGQSPSSSPGLPPYQEMDPDLLATDPKNFVVPHASLEKLQVRKGGSGSPYKFRLEYTTPERKSAKVEGQLVPPPSTVEKAGGSGSDHDYATMVREVYQRALPSIASEALTEWDL